MTNPHQRWASPQMLAVFDRRSTTQHYHDIWLRVLRLQIDAGIVQDPDGQIYDSYNAVADCYACYPDHAREFDQRVDQTEQRTRHELKAHLEVFDASAGGYGKIHLGMTSSDVTEVTWQRQTVQATEMLQEHLAEVIATLAHRASKTSYARVVGRTHGQPAQMTTVSKRLADHLQELCLAWKSLADRKAAYRQRGIVGAIGDQADLRALADPSSEQTASLLDRLRNLDPLASLLSCGQSYPRQIDSGIADACVQVCAALARLATTIRLMATLGQASETSTVGQVGSSAMAHKSNPRYSERVVGLHQVAVGYQTMLSTAAAGQWLEGDVANSCVRRIALPGVFYAADGACTSMYHALSGLRFEWNQIQQDVQDTAHLLATGRLLAAATQAGVPREKAHAAIRWAVGQTHGADGFADALADHPDLPFTSRQVLEIIDAGQFQDPNAAIERVLRSAGHITRNYDIGKWRPDPR